MTKENKAHGNEVLVILLHRITNIISGLHFKTIKNKLGYIKDDIIRTGISKWEFEAEMRLDWKMIVSKDENLYSKAWWDAQHLIWAHNCTMKLKTTT